VTVPVFSKFSWHGREWLADAVTSTNDVPLLKEAMR